MAIGTSEPAPSTGSDGAHRVDGPRPVAAPTYIAHRPPEWDRTSRPSAHRDGRHRGPGPRNPAPPHPPVVLHGAGFGGRREGLPAPGPLLSPLVGRSSALALGARRHIPLTRAQVKGKQQPPRPVVKGVRARPVKGVVEGPADLVRLVKGEGRRQRGHRRMVPAGDHLGWVACASPQRSRQRLRLPPSPDSFTVRHRWAPPVHRIGWSPPSGWTTRRPPGPPQVVQADGRHQMTRVRLH